MNSASERQGVLRAAVDRIIPADDAPSASDAGVLIYIERKFGRDVAGRATSFAAGLGALHDEAVARFGRTFESLGTAEQDDVLRFIEAGTVIVDWPVNPSQFFTLLVESTMEGYYGDPANGGNRDEVAWKMCGFKERLRI
jgi:hypothetical protein